MPRVKGGFIDRYIFPDGELTGAAGLITALQDAGLEMRHPENLREHYARTGAVVRGTRCGRRSASESRKFG